ncbi:type III-B CRISPR module-associated protein Cmr5 [Paenibacillus chitinolyticus]|uniref:type III-B CRISPR module-associated protein Cmr5 n=1 Tax=Paenibacillus chitinolyticus TaxID=79263 RepID=UPI0036637918
MPRQMDNERAAYAYDRVKTFCEDPSNKQEKTLKEFRSLARSLPSMIQINGFGAAIAFLYAKKKGLAHNELYMMIFCWLKQQGIVDEDSREFMEVITVQSRDGYKRMTWETMGLLSWIKRFAEGMIEVEQQIE